MAEELPKQIIVTTRESGPLKLDGNFIEISLEPFTDEQLEKFVVRWFRGGDRDPGELLDFLAGNPSVRDICRRPLVATLVAAQYESGYGLAHSKSEVYSKRFELLLEKWDASRHIRPRTRVRPNDKLTFLTRLAFELHRAGRRSSAKQDIEDLWREGFADLYPDCSTEDILWELRVFNNVISLEGHAEYSLGHLSFQEFLAARAVIHLQRQDVLIDNFYDRWWRQVIVFYAGLCGDISSFLEELQLRRGVTRDDGLLLAMTCEARFTSRVVRDFLEDALDTDILDDPSSSLERPTEDDQAEDWLPEEEHLPED
jgi:hypothetical protein